MVTKQDLVEAYSFNRGRLVTAFVSGATGARAIEPARPGRNIVGGLALAGLLLAGAAIARSLSPSLPENCSHDPGVNGSREIVAIYGISEEAPTAHVDVGEAAQVTGPGR